MVDYSTITNNSAGDLTTSLPTNSTAQGYLNDLILGLPSVAGGGSVSAVTVAGTPGSPDVNLGTANVGLVATGASVIVHGSQSPSVIGVLGNSFVQLAEDKTSDGKPIHYDVVAGSGNNVIVLNKGPSIVYSTTGNDVLVSNGGKDTIYGGSGHDTIYGGGKSEIHGGPGGDDIIAGNDAGSHDTIYAGTGGDSIVLTDGNNTVIGNQNAGADYIQAGVGQDTIYGGIAHGTTFDTIWGGGNTEIHAGTNNIINLQGSDRVIVDGADKGSDTIRSSNGAGQLIDNTANNNKSLTINVAASAVHDTIFGGATTGDTVHLLGQSSTDVASQTTNASGVTTLTFNNSSQVLEVKNVHVTFNDDKNALNV